MSIHVVANFSAKQHSETALRQLLIEIMESVRKAPGCLRCNLVTSREGSGEYAFIEEWINQEAVDTHMTEPEVLADINKILLLVIAPPKIRLYAAC
ncbi:MAG: putative quinol monooxygenase [Azonexus sp.]